MPIRRTTYHLSSILWKTFQMIRLMASQFIDGLSLTGTFSTGDSEGSAGPRDEFRAFVATHPRCADILVSLLGPGYWDNGRYGMDAASAFTFVDAREPGLKSKTLAELG